MSNLSNAFGGSAKAGDVQDPFAMLAPAAPAPVAPGTAPAPAEQAEVAAPPAAPVTAPQPRTAPSAAPRTSPSPTRTAAGPRPSKKQAPKRVSEEDDDLGDATSQVQVYLMPWAKKAAGRLREEEGLTNADIAYDAIDSVRDLLPELVRARRVDQRPADSAFPGRSTRRRPRHVGRGESARTLWAVQATSKERVILEEMAERFEADSISQLVSAAVEEYLGARTQRR